MTVSPVSRSPIQYHGPSISISNLSHENEPSPDYFLMLSAFAQASARHVYEIKR
ncbi:hypothetical protein ACFL27_13715 [candidate division CSSED10-310 bacterium]|uniref:Uncharacterized protein n=1 Tax=candidate division CSSED10-310 bacterium TaxID=2855610 RepID=A0ABV6YYW3_UNCC1